MFVLKSKYNTLKKEYDNLMDYCMKMSEQQSFVDGIKQKALNNIMKNTLKDLTIENLKKEGVIEICKRQ